MRVAVPHEQVLRLLAPGPLVLVTALHKERFTLTPVGWSTPLSQRPALVGIVVRPDRFVHELIRSSGEFGLSIVTKEETGAAFRSGLISGSAQPDLFTTVDLTPTAGKRISAPLVDEAIGTIECAVLRMHDIGDHTLFVGEVLIAEADENAFDGYWGASDKRPIHYLGGNQFAELGERFPAQ